jgi:Na+-driven multidrug efflux pump
MYIVLAVQMGLSIILDTFLVSNLFFSLKVGVNGIAITNIIVNFMMVVISILLLKREGIRIFSRAKLSFDWLREWFKVGGYSGLDSFVRNFAYMMMIIRMVNKVQQQGNYWVANSFIWNWLLLPCLALGDLIKRETGENKNNIQTKTVGYISLSAIFTILWLITIPLWKPFLHYVMNVKDFDTVFYIAIIQTVFYIVYIFNNICDSTFYGVGRTDYMLYQSLIVNILYYGGAFILYLKGVFVPSLFSISMLFGFGMVFDFIPTMGLYIKMLHDLKFHIFGRTIK